MPINTPIHPSTAAPARKIRSEHPTHQTSQTSQTHQATEATQAEETAQEQEAEEDQMTTRNEQVRGVNLGLCGGQFGAKSVKTGVNLGLSRGFCQDNPNNVATSPLPPPLPTTLGSFLLAY